MEGEKDLFLPAGTGGWVAETLIPQQKLSTVCCARGKRRTIPKRPRKNPSGYNTPRWHPLFLQPRSKNNSPFARKALCPYQIPLKSPFIQPAPRAMLSRASRLFYCLPTPRSSPGRGASDAAAAHPRRQDPGSCWGIRACSGGCSGGSLAPRQGCQRGCAAPCLRAAQVCVSPSRFVSPRVTLSWLQAPVMCGGWESEQAVPGSCRRCQTLHYYPC